jgi:hypothetical protein
MRYVLAILIIAVLAFGGGWLLHPRPVAAQTPAAYTMSGAAAHTTCLTPATGAYFLCVASDGVWVSNNGAAYFQIVPQAGTVGVTSVQQCNLAGANCGTVQTGAVVLKVPQTVAITTPTVTTSATSSVTNLTGTLQ